MLLKCRKPKGKSIGVNMTIITPKPPDPFPRYSQEICGVLLLKRHKPKGKPLGVNVTIITPKSQGPKLPGPKLQGPKPPGPYFGDVSDITLVWRS